MEIEMILPEEDNNTNILLEEALNQLFGQSDELPQDRKIVIDDIKWLRELYKFRVWVKKKKNILPKFSQDLTNNTPAENALGFMEFSSNILQSIFHISGHYHCALLILSPSMIKYRAQVLTTQFVNKLETQSPLSIGEAFTKFFPQITDIMTIMLCYVLILWLVCPLDPVLQIFILLMLIATPCYYIPELVSMVSGIDVTCSFFKLPLIWFTASGALALSFIFVFLSLLVMYLIRRFIHPGGDKSETIQR